jgi:hypothetical protein
MRYLYGLIAVFSAVFAAIGLVGLVVSINTHDVESGMISGSVLSFFAFIAFLTARFLEK